MLIAMLIGAAAGYGAAVFTWPRLRARLGGLDPVVRGLVRQARALAQRLHARAGGR